MPDHSRKRKRVSASDRQNDDAGQFVRLQEREPELAILVLQDKNIEHQAYDAPESDESDTSERYTDDDSDASTSESGDEQNDYEEDHSGAQDSSGDEESHPSIYVEPSKAYKESQECLPVSPIFDTDITEIEVECNKIASDVYKRLRKAKGSRSELIENYISEATKVSGGYRTRPIVIGLFGKTGAGKSETVNSILDKPGLAKAVAAGKACTAVAIEYTAATPGQIKAFQARVYFFDADKRSILLQEQIETYFFYLSIRPKYGRQNKDKDLEAAWRPRYNTAIDTFRALFCGRADFRNKKSIDKYLKQRGRKALNAIHKDMITWCDKLLQKRNAHSSRAVERECVEDFEHGTIKALRKAIDPFTTSTKACRSAALWPLVEKVSIACRESRVLETAVIADLPGIADTNRVRVQAARRYIMQCDYLAIVADVDRICDDTTVTNILDQYVDRFRGKIIIIATKTDTDVTQALVDHFKEEKSNMKIYYSLKAEARSKSKNITELNRKAELDLMAELGQMAELDKNMTERSSHDSFAELSEKRANLQKAMEVRKATQSQEKTKLLQQIDSIEVQMFDFMIGLRNKKIETELRRNTKPYCGKRGDMPIYLISNTHYAAAKGYLKVPNPCLSPKATGIPALREHLLELTVSSRTKAFNSYLDYTCGALIRGLLVWTDGAMAKDGDHPRPKLKQVRTGLVDIVMTKQSAIKDLVDNRILLPLRDRRTQSKVSEQAPRIIEMLQAKEWRWNTVKSFVRYHGKNENSVKPDIDWNKLFSRLAISQFILPLWKGMRDKFDMELIDVEREVRIEMESIGNTVYSDPDAQHLPLHNFVNFIKIIVEELLSKIRGFVEANDKRLLNVQLQAITQAEFFAQAMESTYATCVAMRGPGVKRRILKCIEEHVLCKGSNSPFAVLGSKITDEISFCFQEFVDESKEAFDSATKRIDYNFENMIVSQDKADRDLAQRAQIREFLAEQKIEERFLAQLAKRDAIFAKPEYANVPVKEEDTLA